MRNKKNRRAGRTAHGIFLFASAMIALSCAARTPVAAPTFAEAAFPPVEAPPYRLQAGDQIAVKFWGNEALDQELVIRPDGMISLPFVDEVQAVGLTPAELDSKLSQLYTSELAAPDITVIVRNAGGQEIFIGGEVEGQGAYPFRGGISLYQAIQQAGGFRITARRNQVVVIRTTSERKRIAASVNLMPVVSGGDPAADIPLQAADIVFVPRVKITSLPIFLNRYFYDLLPINQVSLVRLLETDSR